MFERVWTVKTWPGTGRYSRAGVAALFVWTTILFPVFAETTSNLTAAQTETNSTAPALQDTAGSAATRTYTFDELEYLLAPIALFPDTLLALILPASADPLQLIHAEHWLVDNEKAAGKGDFSSADELQLDAAVLALLRFPDIVEMLNDHLDWTESLGTAFSKQPGDVAAVIQILRTQANSVGNLKTTPQQTVTIREEPAAATNSSSGGTSTTQVIYIAPTNPERIYVPVYNPATVFTSPVATGALLFGTGVLVGSAWNNSWGWNNRGWNNGGWNNNNTVNINVNRPDNRLPGAWRPDRPATRPDRPGVVPDRPGLSPDRPGVRPDRPGTRPDRPGVRPERPGMRPDRPVNRPGRPDTRPERPSMRPDRPATRPDRPQMRPDRPNARPDRPQTTLDRPTVRSDRPSARPNRPANRVTREQEASRQPQRNPQRGAGAQQQRNRPQQSARQQQQRPQQAARPQQQRNRPQQAARPQQQRSQQTARPQQQRNQQGVRQQQRGGNNNCRRLPNGQCR